MNDLVSNNTRSAHLAGIASSMIYYQRRKREPQYDVLSGETHFRCRDGKGII